MKLRESGMPQESMWNTFFDSGSLLSKMGLDSGSGLVADFGCGYGTFSFPAARMTNDLVYALDIDPEMIRAVTTRARGEGDSRIRAALRDIPSSGSGLSDGSVGYVMLFNILHGENPVSLLKEALRILVPGGKAGIIHWKYEKHTPRGPSMEIRPKPGECSRWAQQAGFMTPGPEIDLPPFHYGVIAVKPWAGERTKDPAQ